MYLSELFKCIFCCLVLGQFRFFHWWSHMKRLMLGLNFTWFFPFFFLLSFSWLETYMFVCISFCNFDSLLSYLIYVSILLFPPSRMSISEIFYQRSVPIFLSNHFLIQKYIENSAWKLPNKQEKRKNIFVWVYLKLEKHAHMLILGKMRDNNMNSAFMVD